MKRIMDYLLKKKLIIIYWALLITITLIFRFWLHDSRYLAIELLRTDFYDKETIYTFTTTLFQSLITITSLPIAFMTILTAFYKKKSYGVSVVKFVWQGPIARIADLESLVFLCFSNVFISYVCLAYNFFTGLVSSFLFSVIFITLMAGHLVKSFIYPEQIDVKIKASLNDNLIMALNKGMEAEGIPDFVINLFSHTKECIFSNDLITLQKNFHIIKEHFSILLAEEKDKENSILFLNYYSCIEGLIEEIVSSKHILEGINYSREIMDLILKNKNTCINQDGQFNYLNQLEKRFYSLIENLDIKLDNYKIFFKNTHKTRDVDEEKTDSTVKTPQE